MLLLRKVKMVKGLLLSLEEVVKKRRLISLIFIPS